MDGVRAYWNGEKLISKNGNDITTAPPWFTESLPKDIQLDGELWMGQGTSHRNVTPVLNTKNGDWSQIGYFLYPFF